MAWMTLIELRKKNGMSQEELADKIGVSQKSISKYEKQDVRPSWEALLNIANLFDVSTDYLLGRISDDSISNIAPSTTSIHALSENEAMLLDNFKKLTKEDQVLILGKTIELVREQLHDQQQKESFPLKKVK